MERRNRTMNYLSVPERVAVIREYDVVKNIAHLAKKFRCGRRQIKHILRRRDDYLAEWANNPQAMRMPRRQPSRVKAVNIVLSAWAKRSQQHDIEITDELLREVAKKIASSLRITEFRSDARWIERFKKKYKISEDGSIAIVTSDCNPRVIKSLGIEDIIKEMKSQVDAAMTKPFRNPVPNSTEGTAGNSSGSDNSDDMVEFVDVLTDSCQSEGSCDNVMITTNGESSVPAQGNTSHGHFLEGENFDPSDYLETTDIDGPKVKEISNYKEALNHLGPLEQFALMKENIRAIGLINQIENIFRDEMEKAKLQKFK